MNKNIIPIAIMAALGLAVMACTAPASTATAQADINQIVTITPNYYLTSSALPCNAATVVDVENWPDFIVMGHNISFNRNLRFTNVGTCTWNTNYRLVFMSGNRLSGPKSKNLSASVAPGGSIDVQLHLISPLVKGRYTGCWHLYADNDIDIIPVCVSIDVAR